ncbi:MAG: isovaleryl-CoA dehydrogenase [Planctomycetota bacterium]|nr:MAG: isovaleryl-CoA dehydrogenase [Planctomycetota bacterium]
MNAHEIRERARAFAREEVAPHATQWDRDKALPRELFTRMGALGFLAGPLPTEHGGSGWSNRAFLGVYEELGAVCSSTRGFLAVHTGLVSQCLHDHGTPAQRARWLPKLATGELVGCYALTEPEAGSDVGSLTTRAERDGDHWVVHGEKVWITNGGIADLAILFARTGPGEGRKGLTGFVVELPSEGWTSEHLGEEALGHRASDHVRLKFDGLRVPDDQRLGEIGAGFGIAMSALDHGRLGVAAGAVGIARGCLEEALDHARTRKQFGQRIGDFQMVQSDLAEIYAGTEAAAALVERAAAAADAAHDVAASGADAGSEAAPTREEVTRLTSAAKFFATENAQTAATKAVLLLGNRGYGDDHRVERHYRDIQGLRIYEGTNHIQRLIIARSLLGRP